MILEVYELNHGDIAFLKMPATNDAIKVYVPMLGLPSGENHGDIAFLKMTATNDGEICLCLHADVTSIQLPDSSL